MTEINPITKTYPIFHNGGKITAFSYPKEKVLDDLDFDIKENLKLFYNEKTEMMKIQLGVQSHIFHSRLLSDTDKDIEIYEETYVDEKCKERKITLIKKIALPSSLNAWKLIEEEEKKD